MHIFKIINKKKWFTRQEQGMTYVELIVVLSIFSVMSAIILFNYGKFQAKVDIKNLANNIALKIVEAQKSAMSGELPPLLQQTTAGAGWKPSYGVYFDLRNVGNKSLIYFTDLDKNQRYDTNNTTFCNNQSNAGECLDKINITSGNNSIGSITAFYQSGACPASIIDVNIVFTRPDSGAIMTGSQTAGCVLSSVDIALSSPQISGVAAHVKVFSSGRIQIK